MKFLIVDDHALIREAMCGLLMGLRPGAQVHEAADAQAILKALGVGSRTEAVLAVTRLGLTLPPACRAAAARALSRGRAWPARRRPRSRWSGRSGPSAGATAVAVAARVGQQRPDISSVAEQIKHKIKQPPSGAQIGDTLARGEADLGFQQVTELM